MAIYRDVIVLEGNKVKSPTWLYFDVKDEEKRLATCNLCQEVYSFRTSVTNLAKHLKYKHKLVISKSSDADENGRKYVVEQSQENAPEDNKLRTGTQAWDYFNIKSAEDKLASCTECEEILSYKENEDQLLDHLLIAHSITVQKDADTEKKDDESTVEYEVVEETHMAVSVWEYFDKKDESSETATCNICEEVISYKESVDKMLEHLLLKHDISKTYDEIQETESDADTKDTSKGGRNSRSAAWDYFVVSDQKNKLAICQICNETYSFKTSVTNLMKHARRHLGKDFRKRSLNQTNQSSSPTKPKLGHPSRAWHFFKSLSRTRKVALCLVCKKRLSYATSVSNLKRHLQRKHPRTWQEMTNMEDGTEAEIEGEKKKRIVLSTDDHVYELDAKSEEENYLSVSDDDDNQDENVEEMETVYLEEFEDQIRKRQEQKLTSNNRMTHKRSDLNGAITDKSSRDNIPIGNNSDSLDHFGSYIVSLLKQLPKNVSYRLQMDFVRQIMEAQINQVTASENHSCDTLVINNNNNDESNQSTSAPDVWSFFEKETGGRARCVVCRATLPHRAKELKNHLKENHPKLAQDFDDESENDEDQNDTYTEVVYLEDDTRKPTPKRDAQFIMKRRHSVKKAPTPILKKVKRRKSSSSSDDYPLRNKKDDDNDDQIEKFGTYITCLLKKMPKDVCTKLQMDIINLIMTAKLKLPSETPPLENKVVLEGVPVAIQTVNAVPGTGYIVTVPTSSSDVSKETVTVTSCEVKNDPLTQDNRDMPKITVSSPVTQNLTVNNC